jgi:uncharacterized protein YkwD
MKKLGFVRRTSIHVRVAPRLIGLVVLSFSIGAYSLAVAQSATSRPVARLIVDSGTTAGNPKPGAPTNATPSIADATDAERRAFEVTNEFREKNGLAPLTWDPQLCLLARTHSRNMSVLGFFSHQTPEGLRLKDRARVAGLRYHVIAENIAYNQGFDDPGGFAVERWTLSPGHRANLLSPEFRGSGIGSFIAPDGTVFLTQLFILR